MRLGKYQRMERQQHLLSKARRWELEVGGGDGDRGLIKDMGG